MPYKLREFTCIGCGEVVERQAPAASEQRCINCAIARSVENIRQLRRKCGPMYQRWLAGITAGVAREQEWGSLAAQLEDIGFEDPG